MWRPFWTRSARRSCQGPSYGAAFHGVKSGSNGVYSAGTGYGKVTGWGSDNGAGVLGAELG
ncbi:hypothetical protein ABH931_001890 [Streptacidiphilus sp. MAP12-33]|uniref:hypothetical protein n=1 Tax=Streptacidiphilus sp. MAP12-33 TaxID=3156266 RepID=UPI0035153605